MRTTRFSDEAAKAESRQSVWTAQMNSRKHCLRLFLFRIPLFLLLGIVPFPFPIFICLTIFFLLLETIIFPYPFLNFCYFCKGTLHTINLLFNCSGSFHSRFLYFAFDFFRPSHSRVPSVLSFPIVPFLHYTFSLFGAFPFLIFTIAFLIAESDKKRIVAIYVVIKTSDNLWILQR